MDFIAKWYPMATGCIEMTSVEDKDAVNQTTIYL